MKEAIQTEEGIQVTFKDNLKALIPYADISPGFLKEKIKDVMLPNQWVLEIFYNDNSSPTQFPWDVVCFYCPQKQAELRA
jgi:hypothetical protein